MARYDFSTQRLFVDAPLQSGGHIETDRAQANYLVNVLRLKPGAEVLLFNGRDGEWLAELAEGPRKTCLIRPLRQTRPQHAPYPLSYCFAPLKQARLDYMVQKAVEMGAGTLQPVLTQHGQVSRINLERMRANVVEAAEQCGILSLAECRSPVKLAKLLDEWPADRPLIFCDESAAVKNPYQALAPLAGQEPGLLIGPEGGFSQAERTRLNDLPFVTPISLGPRILRADTAAVAALAIVQATCGDWRE